jgi:acyl-coenzyme A synthetase/AMP-(fatty) acid ligase
MAVERLPKTRSGKILRATMRCRLPMAIMRLTGKMPADHR